MIMTSLSPVVVKLGGSLLALPDLATRIDLFNNSLCGRRALFIVGGGAAANEIRRLDQRFGLYPSEAHWDAIAAMTLNAAVLSRVVRGLPLVENRFAAEMAWKTHTAAVLNARTFLQEEWPREFHELPESWDVTSDTIAAFVALRWPSDRIVFCKSCDPISRHLSEISGAGQFDSWIPNLCELLQEKKVSVDWVHLSHDNPDTISLQPD